ncbi:MAG: hypothetical protein EBX39_13035 [Actinobacteria bacterium]|nr:hypothetical protein [Actinomycetota bacterium]
MYRRIDQSLEPLTRRNIVGSIEKFRKSDEEYLFDNVRDRHALAEFFLDLWISINPTSNSFGQAVFEDIHRKTKGQVVVLSDRAIELQGIEMIRGVQLGMVA